MESWVNVGVNELSIGTNDDKGEFIFVACCTKLEMEVGGIDVVICTFPFTTDTPVITIRDGDIDNVEAMDWI